MSLTHLERNKVVSDMLHVCPLSQLDATLKAYRPTHVLSLVSPGTVVALPDDYCPTHHLVLEFNDIPEERQGFLAPSCEHVLQILEFGRSVPSPAPLLVHCWAGVSRSTAAAYMIACDQLPTIHEAWLAAYLRDVSPVATPNPRLVALADSLLQRHERMTRAIAQIGRGAETFEGNCFTLNFDEMRKTFGLVSA